MFRPLLFFLPCLSLILPLLQAAPTSTQHHSLLHRRGLIQSSPLQVYPNHEDDDDDLPPDFVGAGPGPGRIPPRDIITRGLAEVHAKYPDAKLFRAEAFHIVGARAQWIHNANEINTLRLLLLWIPPSSPHASSSGQRQHSSKRTDSDEEGGQASAAASNDDATNQQVPLAIFAETALDTHGQDWEPWEMKPMDVFSDSIPQVITKFNFIDWEALYTYRMDFNTGFSLLAQKAAASSSNAREFTGPWNAVSVEARRTVSEKDMFPEFEDKEEPLMMFRRKHALMIVERKMKDAFVGVRSRVVVGRPEGEANDNFNRDDSDYETESEGEAGGSGSDSGDDEDDDGGDLKTGTLQGGKGAGVEAGGSVGGGRGGSARDEWDANVQFSGH